MADEVLLKIAEKIKKTPWDVGLYEDYYAVGFYCPLELKWLCGQCEREVPKLIDSKFDDALRMMEVHKKSLRALAPVDFDAYCQYIEWNREPSKSFYRPRRKALLPIVEAFQRVGDGKLKLLTISLPPGTGKLLADDTPVMTREGWKKHGELVVGDEVVGLDGRFVKVEHVFPKDVANYEITFSNGEKMKCHENHEWLVSDRRLAGTMKIRTVKDMLAGGLDSGEAGHRGHRWMYNMPNCGAMVGTKRDLPVAPYVLGAWLGDGTTNKPSITVCHGDECIVHEVLRAGYTTSGMYEQTGCAVYHFLGLREDLRRIGMCQSRNAVEKFIPQEYITASVEQRLDLLAGLLDTDGTKGREGRYQYCTTNEKLRDGVCDLLATFGWRYSVTRSEPSVSTSGIVGKHTVYVISVHPDMYVPCRVERKKMHAVAKRRMVSITDIQAIEPVQGNCIQVEGGYYRVGKTMQGTHNSTLSLFFMTWMAGRHPELPMLTGSHSNSFIRGVYDEALRIMDPVGEYLWHEVFPQVPVSNTNAKDCRIDLGKRKRFDTFQFTTIGSGNAGLYRAQGLLYCDDLVSGIEVALSKERLDKLWETYTTDLRQRKQGDCPEVHVATRWSVHDVLGRLEERYGGQEDAAFLRFPAMNEKDESNFDYPYGVGFSTEFYRGQREIMDDASWRALYMNEPIEREGQLYDGDLLRRYFELPMGEPDAIIAVCDTKDKGSDYAVLPVVYVYGQDYYLEECLCDDGLPETVDVRMVDILYRHKVQMCRFESNSAGGRIAEKVQNEVKKRGGITHITTKFTSANKETKIIVNSAWVKEHVLFKDSTTYKRGSEYGKMMEWLTAYTVAGKNRHDDVPDAMAMLAEYAQTFTAVKFQVMARPF